jgi:hypothetical protein
MSLKRFPVTVVVERIPIANRWASEQWRVAAVEPSDAGPETGDAMTGARAEQADVADGANDSPTSTSRSWRVGGLFAELHASEAQGYYLNITAPAPKVFVMCRLTESAADHDMPKLRPQLVTVSYDEAARFMDGGEQVEAVPLALALLDWMRPFVVANYRPEPPRKVRRNELYERDGAVDAATSRKRVL